LLELRRHSYVPPFLIAAAYIGIGEKETAFEWLERAYETRDIHLFPAAFGPVLDPVRDDSRYRDLIRRMGLHEYAK
jgi:hypothetical protein